MMKWYFRRKSNFKPFQFQNNFENLTGIDVVTYHDSISTFKSNAIKAFGKIFEIESLAKYPNLAIELESLAGCDPTADADCNLKLLCTNSDGNMHFDNENEPKCNEKELRKCILKILLSQITKGIGFYRLHLSQI